MSFQWLQMRITEEQDRRQKEADILSRLPAILDEVYQALVVCAQAYNEAFGGESVEIRQEPQKIVATVRDQNPPGSVTVTMSTDLPGIRIERDSQTKDIIVGLLPGESAFYKDEDQFLTMEELTRRILDRAFFPKLGE